MSISLDNVINAVYDRYKHKAKVASLFGGPDARLWLHITKANRFFWKGGGVALSKQAI
jgi:hypothetical protein